VCLAAVTSGQARGADNAAVRSYRAQFVVSAPDVEYASEIARLCEQIHERTRRLLGARGLWEGQASVLIERRTVEGEEGPETVWHVSVARGGVVRATRGLGYGQVEDFLRSAVCFHVVRDVAQASADAHGGTLRGRAVPFWLSAGFAELMEPQQRLDLFRNTATAIRDRRSFLLDDVFEHTGLFESPDQRAIFLQQAATVVDFLLSAKQGPDRLRRALENLWRRSTFTFSLRWEYRDLFPSLEPMAAAWEEYVRERPSRILSEERLTLAQTEALLQRVLQVDIPVIAKDTIEQSVVHTDFEGLAKHDNRLVARRICKDKATQLLQLLLRSAPEFKPALEAYARALNAIRDGRTRRFHREFKGARREHEAVRRLPYFTEPEED
jgi:hypothetical protein